MASTFEIATRAAIEEIIGRHAQESKFGLIIGREGLGALTGELFELLQTSRNLKSAGDRFIRGMSTPKEGGKPSPNPVKRPNF